MYWSINGGPQRESRGTLGATALEVRRIYQLDILFDSARVIGQRRGREPMGVEGAGGARKWGEKEKKKERKGVCKSVKWRSTLYGNRYIHARRFDRERGRVGKKRKKRVARHCRHYRDNDALCLYDSYSLFLPRPVNCWGRREEQKA